MGLVGDSRKILSRKESHAHNTRICTEQSPRSFVRNCVHFEKSGGSKQKTVMSEIACNEHMTGMWLRCSSSSAWQMLQMWQVITSCREGGHFLPREAGPFWSWRRFRWWISSRSPGGTWQTWASSLSPAGCVSIPCRSSDRTGLRWYWSRNTRPGTQVEGRPGISQTTTARWLRVRRGGCSVRPGQGPSCLCPCQALHPRLASQDPFHFTGSTWPLDRPHWSFTTAVWQKPSRNRRKKLRVSLG